jgi:hypothetical protein
MRYFISISYAVKVKHIGEIIFFECYNVSSEEHLKKSQSSRDSYLDLQLSISVQIFEIYLVTMQSLEGDRITSFNCFFLCSGEEREEEVVVVYSRHCSGSVEWAR